MNFPRLTADLPPSPARSHPLSAEALLATFPPEVQVSPTTVANSNGGQVLIVLDDDPTGTQSVADLPVLTQWEPQDFRWAFDLRVPAIYVLTNTRGLSADEAAERNKQIVANALDAADGIPLVFVSRGDSTLRGHFPLETDVIAHTLKERAGVEVDGVVIALAFPEAGRVTINGVHYMRSMNDELTPVADTEFARDATFGFSHSRLADYVEEKSAGRLTASSVIEINLGILRAGPLVIADALEAAVRGTHIAVDAVTENDLRMLALGLAESERRGKRFIYRAGPPLVRARIGQAVRAPLTDAEVFGHTNAVHGGGLIVVGSHVSTTTRQLSHLAESHASAVTVELNVEKLFSAEPHTHANSYLDSVVAQIVDVMSGADVILHTSRTLVRTTNPSRNLEIARTVSAAVVEVVQRVLTRTRPRFVIAKGGITSSDVATHGLAIRHAIVRGSLLPGIVSVWEPIGGPATGIPYVVFAGNVGDDDSLLLAVRTLSAFAA